MELRRTFRRGLSLLLVLCTLLSITGTAFAAPVLEPQLIPGERMEQEPGKNAIYFGVLSANLEEKNGLYEVQIFRTGDLSKEIDLEVQTLDVTALYGEDYVLRGKNIQVYGGDMTQLQRNATQDLRLEIVSETEQEQAAPEGVPASQVSSLAALKEAQTGEKTRDLTETTIMYNMAEQMQDLFVPDVGGVMDCSAVLPLHFDAGQDELRVQVEILDDEKSESDELFTLLLANLSDLEMQTSNTCSLMIVDNEPAVHSTVSFTASKYYTVNGYAEVTLRREGAEDTLADFRIRSVDGTAVAGTDYTPVDEILTFAPYETEKNVLTQLNGTGGYTLELSEFKGCEPGEITTVEISGDVDFKSPLLAMASAPEENAVVAASETPSLVKDEHSFNISIGDKDYKVEYDSVFAATGKIYDESYTPKLWVGNYIFPVDDSRQGWFYYNIFTGPKPWGCGYRASEYCVQSEEDASQNYGRLRYYHTSILRLGSAEMRMKDDKLTSIYYQFFAPDWACIDNMFGGQRSRFVYHHGSDSTVTKEVKGKFGRTRDSANIAVGITEGGTLSYPSDRRVYFEVKAVDADKGKTPKSYVNAYGFAAMFKRFDVQMEPAEKLTYMTLSGESSPVEAAQVTVKCGAQQTSNGTARSIYVNDDAKSSNLVFSIGNNHINGHDGKFAKIVGYTITVGSGVDKVVLQYPQGLIDFINAAEFQKDSCLDYSASGKQAAIEQIQENLDTIPMSGYFISWIERNQKQVTKTSDTSYFQSLSFKPKLAYYDVQVQVKANDLASFKNTQLTPGTHTFHGGDYLNMDANVNSPNHYLAGFEYSLNGGIDYYFVPSSDKTLFLEPYNSYIVRPVVAEIDNYIEVEMTEAAKEHLEVLNTIPAESLESHNILAGKTLLMCNTLADDVYDQMLPEVASSYQISVKVKDGHAPSDSGKVFVATIYDPVTEKTYTGNVFNHIAKTRINDNRLVLDVQEVDKDALLQFDIETTLLCKARPVRATGLTENLIPMSGRMVMVANGDLSKDPEQIASNSMEDGFVSLYGVKSVAGSWLRLMISDGLSEAQIYDLQIPQDMTSAQTVYTPEKIEMGYSYSYPKVYDVLYSYGKADNNQNSDNTQNSVNIMDDYLTLLALLDDKGKQIDKVEFVVQTVTGETTEYAAVASENNPGEYTATIQKMLDNLYNGDRLYVRVIGTYTAEDGTEMEIQYPLVDTGIVFYLENAIKVPQSYEAETPKSDNLPILGKASSKSAASLLSFNRTNWEDGTGYTLDINITVDKQNNKALSTKDKQEKVGEFFGGIKNAKKADTAYGKAIKAMEQSLGLAETFGKGGMKDLKNYYVSEATKFAEKAESLGNNNAKKMQTGLNSAGWTFNVSGAIMIQLNFVYNAETNDYVLAYTAIAFGAMGMLMKTFYFMIGYAPFFFNITLNAILDLLVSFGCNTEESLGVISESEFQKYPGNLEPLLRSPTKTNFGLTFKATGSVGIGMCGVLSARGGLTVVMEFDTALGGAFIDGFVFGLSVSVSLDAFVGTINFELLSPTIGTGTLEGKNGVKFFGGLGDDGTGDDETTTTYAMRNGAAAEAAEPEEPDKKILVQSDDGTLVTYQETSAGTADMSAFGGRPGMVRAILEPVYKNILLENAATRTKPQLIKLDDGRMLLTFVGARSAEDSTQMLYYAYHDGMRWGTPQLVCDDGTFDSTPSLLKVGDKVVLSWADAKRTFTAEDTAKTKLQTLEIAYAVLDTGTGTMGQKIVFTDDDFFNFAPGLSLAGDTVYCSYMKRDIEAVTREDELLNFEGLYSTMAYASYNLADGSKQSEQYITLRHPTMRDPLTMDYNCQTMVIDGRTYMVSTYTVDEDMRIATTEGKTLWLEITDLAAGKSYYPICLSGEDVSVAAPKLTALKDTLYLTYLEDGERFCLMDAGRMLRDLFEEAAAGTVYRNASTTDTQWYKKTAQDLGMPAEPGEEDFIYEDSIYDRLYRGEFPVDSVNFHVDEENTSAPSEYVLTTNGDDLYVFYLDKSRTDSESMGNELFGVRYVLNSEGESSGSENTESSEVAVVDYEEEGFAKSSQITSYGKGIDEITLVMDEYNCVNVVANYYSIEHDEEGRMKIGPNSLAEFKFVPAASLSIDEQNVEFEERMVVGEEAQVAFDVVNDGVLPTTGYDLTVKLEKGGSETVVYSVTRENLHMSTGADKEETFLLPVSDDLEDAALNFYVAEHDTNASYQKLVASKDVPYGAEVDVTDMTFEEENGETYLYLEYENVGNKTSDAISAKTEIVTAEGKSIRTVDTFQIPALASGETFTHRMKVEPEVSDYGSFGLVYIRNFGEANGEEAFFRTAYKAYTAPKTVEINDGAETVTLKQGEQTKLNVKVAPYASMAGTPVFSSSNPGAAKVDAAGNVSAVGIGDAEIKVLYPKTGLSETITVRAEQANLPLATTPAQPEAVEKEEEKEDVQRPVYSAFLDLKSDAWYRDSVEYVLDNGIMNGVSENTFAPDDPTSRSMLVTMLWRLAGEPETDAVDFHDVAEGSWYSDAVDWAATNGIVTGYGETTFGPADSVTREQLATILYRYAVHNGDAATTEENLTGFADGAQVSPYAVSAMNWAVGQNIINGMGGKLEPQGKATRAQVAAVLMRYLTK